MRIWDIHPGYLNRQSLLGEHRELHGIVSIIVNRKKGYSSHPETLRWKGYGWALGQRHRLIKAEMALRNYSERSPVTTRSGKGLWPHTYIDDPVQQFRILTEKYRDREKGRIPIPGIAQQFWSQHKFSVLARDNELYRDIGRRVSRMKPGHDLSGLAETVTGLLRQPPSAGRLRNALHHMWGFVSEYASSPKDKIEDWSLRRLLREIQHLALEHREPYLTASTALTELNAWIK
ncbi:DUF1722 domain-containing protein [candidate division KSB1 bacterium]